VGWGVANALEKHHRVWVLTWGGARQTIVIEEELRKRPRANLQMLYYRLPGPLERLKTSFGGYGHVVHYYLWQLGAARLAARVARTVPFDIVQHVTYVRYWQPSFLASLPIPLIWGPVGGADATPPPFHQHFSRRGRIEERARGIVRRLAELDPFVRRTIRRSALSVATTPATAARLLALGGADVVLGTEAALHEEEIRALGRGSRTARPRVRFISMGRLIHWKGFHLGLDAFARADIADAEYWIVGDGPERSRLEARARQLGLGDRARFFGWLPRSDSLLRLMDADVLVHPSLHDSGGWVCLEGMAARKPVICLGLGGPNEQVTADAGVKIQALDPDQATGDIAAAMARLAADPDLRETMGEAGRARVLSDYTWEAKTRAHLDQIARAMASSRANEDSNAGKRRVAGAT
jgi:glycosyltransferase involved in cell wall biosynthesis